MDREFDRPINIFTLPYYNNLNKQLEREVGDWLKTNAYANPKRYSNDLRHQYASALYARNVGSDLTNKLGMLNEMFDASGSGRDDTSIDKYNNSIGIQYGMNNPNLSKQELLKLLFNDWQNNVDRRRADIGI